MALDVLSGLHARAERWFWSIRTHEFIKLQAWNTFYKCSAVTQRSATPRAVHREHAIRLIINSQGLLFFNNTASSPICLFMKPPPPSAPAPDARKPQNEWRGFPTIIVLLWTLRNPIFRHKIHLLLCITRMQTIHFCNFRFVLSDTTARRERTENICFFTSPFRINAY